MQFPFSQLFSWKHKSLLENIKRQPLPPVYYSAAAGIPLSSPAHPHCASGQPAAVADPVLPLARNLRLKALHPRWQDPGNPVAQFSLFHSSLHLLLLRSLSRTPGHNQTRRWLWCTFEEKNPKTNTKLVWGDAVQPMTVLYIRHRKNNYS